MRTGKCRLYKKFAKRPIDFVLSACALFMIFPLLVIIAVFVRIKLGKPVLFKQDRPGLNEKIFTLYKFRTMTDKRDENGSLLPDEKRLTAFGKFLRSTSLDELPELWNIVRGDMSLVGPRPLLIQYLPLYNEHHKHRHDVRPGLTGLAQVNGRNKISWEDKLDLDIDYTKNISFWGDMKIIFLTLIRTIKREGITSETAATKEPFIGS